MSAKILALHGFGTNAAFLDMQLEKSTLRSILNDRVQIQTLDGPHTVERPDRVPDYFKGPYHSWWKANKAEDGKMHYRGWQATVTHVEQFMKEEGPFDGILGFSQGACCAVLLAGMRQQGLHLQDLPAFKFAIIIGGFPTRCECRCALVVTWMDVFFRDPDLQAAYRDSIYCPSLHIMGEQDEVTPYSRKVVDYFASPIVLEHSGSHVIPKLDGEKKNTLVNFVTQSLSQATKL